MNAPLWYRSEDKHGEERAVLTPAIVAELIGAGHSVTVERSAQRCFDDDAYASAGATLADGNSWRDAPSDAVIVGLKELNVDTFDLRHRHIHFAHVYKEQQGWQAVLERFKRGGGSLYDLEYLVDDTGRRVAAFGYWAGYAGAAVAVMAWIGQQQDQTPSVAPLSSYSSRDVLLASLTSQLAEPGVVNSGKPTALVIGAKGRSGEGAVELLHNLGIDVIEWDVDETRDYPSTSRQPVSTSRSHGLLMDRDPCDPLISSQSIICLPCYRLRVARISCFSCGRIFCAWGIWTRVYGRLHLPRLSKNQDNLYYDNGTLVRRRSLDLARYSTHQR